MTPRSPSAAARVRRSCLLLLSLAAWSGSACGPRSPEPFEETVTLEGRRLLFCSGGDPDPNAVDDEYSTCLNIVLDDGVLGTGPATLAIDGTLRWEPAAATSEERLAFTPAAEHSPEIEEAFVLKWCGEGPQGPATERLQGQLVLTENSSKRLAGHVTVDVSGRLAGNCGTEGALFDRDFNVPRQP